MHNYPLGAMNDPRAPFAASEPDDVCTYLHPDGEQCEGGNDFQCRCGATVCSAAVVYRTSYATGKPNLLQECADCAEEHMVPANDAQALMFVNRAMRSAAQNTTLSKSDRDAVLNLFEQAAKRIANPVTKTNGTVVMVFCKSW